MQAGLIDEGRKTANATLTCKRKKNRGPRIQLQIRKLSKFIKKKKERIDKKKKINKNK